MRDNFSAKTKKILAKRVGYLCSNPNCKKHTCGPNEIPDKTVNIGVAAHITAASKGGPRYDHALTINERTSLNNGIWLCQNCAKLIDANPKKYSVSKVNKWKASAEKFAKNLLEKNYTTDYNWKYNLSNQLTTFSRVDFVAPVFLIENENGEKLNLMKSVKESSVLISNMISCSYLETSHLIKRDNFHFALSLEVEKIEEKYYLMGELITHLTPFAYRFGVFAELIRKGDVEGLEALFDEFPTIAVKRTIGLGRFLPYKISRVNPVKIEIEFIHQQVVTFKGDLTTSDLILYFSLGVNGKLVIFDDQNKKKQAEKSFRLMNETMEGFDLSEIWINPDDPEKWDFAIK